MQVCLPKLLAYPSVNGKIMIYKSNGTGQLFLIIIFYTGRDIYIANNNGGYCNV